MLILQKEIPENILETLTIVTTVADDLQIPAFIVGATARDLILEYVYQAGIRRATDDIDFGVAVESWEQYEKLKSALISTGKFRDDSKMEQRLWQGRGINEMKIDLVPYGGIESPVGTVTFPPTEFEMNTKGFAEAYQNCLKIKIRDDSEIRLVSLPGLVMLKFVAYDDRPFERQADLQDIWYVMTKYLDAGNEDRLYQDSDLLTDENFNFRTVGARLLGRDLAKILNDQTKKIVLKYLSEDENSGLTRISEIVSHRENRLGENLNEIIEMFQELRRGIFEVIEK